MLSAPPTPIRPPCRTRRRSSSFSTFSSSSSPAAGDDHHRATSPKKGSNRHEGKRARRIDFRGGDSPLKQSQPLFAPVEGPDSSGSLSWTQPSPFSTPGSAFALTCGPLSVAPHAAGSLASLPPPPSTSFFSANARDFFLPSFSTPSTSFTFDAAAVSPSNPFTTRTRHSSSAGDSSFSSSSLSSSPPSSSSHVPSGLVFEDSSFSSATSTTSSRSSPTSTTSNSLNSAYHYASSSSTSTSPASTTAAFTFSCAPPFPLPLPPPALRRVSSCHSPLPSSSDAAMLCDDPAKDAEEEQQVVAEAERLHHVAFEQLRHATSREGEGFVERMRRWEAEQQQAVPSLPPTSAPLVEEEDEDLDLCAEEEEDEVELTLDLGHQDLTSSSPPAVSSTELDDLTRRLRAGACELEDFALVREVQARERGGSRSAVRA